MKQYQITLNVPDHFDPETINISTTLVDPKPEDDISICDEGFVDEESCPVLIDTDEIADKILIDKLEGVSKSTVVIFKYPVELMNPDIIMPIQKMVEAKSGCTTLGLVNDIEILTQNSVEAIKMLQGMINKINANAIVKLS